MMLNTDVQYGLNIFTDIQTNEKTYTNGHK